MVVPKRAAYAEESAEVEVLFANLDKLTGLTKKIQGSLNRLDRSGKNVQAAILPVHGNTRQLQITHRNIDRTLEALDKYKAPLEQREQEDVIIREDPRRVGIKEYIASLERTERSLRGMRGSNQNAVKELTALMKYGARQLEDIFRQTIASNTESQVEPLHYVTKDKPFPTIPNRESEDLRSINRFMVTSSGRSASSTETNLSKIFAEIRGAYMARSLVASAAATMSTARKGVNDAFYKRGNCGIGIYAAAFEGMLVSEFENIQKIYGEDEWPRVLMITSRAATADLSKTLRDLNSQILANIMTDCFLAFEIVEFASEWRRRLDASVPDLTKPMMDLFQLIGETARLSLTKISEDPRVRVQGLASIPQDGSAIPITVEVMNRLQELTKYFIPVAQMLAAIGLNGWKSTSPTLPNPPAMRLFDSSFNSSSEGTTNFAAYCMDTIDTLVTALESRARLLLKSMGAQAVFMLNNLAVVEGMIRSSELGPLLMNEAPKLAAWRAKHVKVYRQAWQGCSQNLLDQVFTNRASVRPASGGGVPDSASIVRNLGGKEKDAIKEKFRAFNAGFDELVARHKSYRMEKETRELLVKELAPMIEPLYARFYDRYHEVDKKGKYVKYKKDELSNIIAQMGVEPGGR